MDQPAVENDSNVVAPVKREMPGDRTVRSVGKILEAVTPQDRRISKDVDFEDISAIAQSRAFGSFGLQT